MKDYDSCYKAGVTAKKFKFKGVVNHLTFDGYQEKEIHSVKPIGPSLEGENVDVLIIGGGIVGSAIARELSKYPLKTMLIDKEEDVALGASSRNDGCLHIGFDLHKGSQKHKYLLRAWDLLPQVLKDLEVDTKKTGQCVAFPDKKLKIASPFLKRHAKKNRVPGGMRVLNRKELLEIEPNIGDEISWALYFPEAMSVSPYLFTIALAENAAMNGVRVELRTLVTGMEVEEGQIRSVITNRGKIYPKLVINAAGVFSDKIAAMAGDETFTIHPRKGTDILFDKKVTKNLSNTAITIFRVKNNSNSHTKGGGSIPTVDGNILLGPDAHEIPDREDYSVSREDIERILAKHKETMPKLKGSDIIAYFSGTRAASYEEDFEIRKGIWCKNILEAGAVQSPGVTAAVAIAEDIASWATEFFGDPAAKKDWNPKRTKIPEVRNLSFEERDALIKKDPAYGKIICRCEEISEGEIRDAMTSVIPAMTTDGVKRRVRAGMGRCQGGFCQMHVALLLAKLRDEKLIEVSKKGDGKILFRETKER